MKEQFLCPFAIMGGQSWRQSLRSPVQVEGGDLRVVPLKVGEVEEIHRGLLGPGLPGRRWKGRGDAGLGQGSPRAWT